jgi:hypothetical protein
MNNYNANTYDQWAYGNDEVQGPTQIPPHVVPPQQPKPAGRGWLIWVVLGYLLLSE